MLGLLPARLGNCERLACRQCPVVAISGHSARELQCLLLGVKRTLQEATRMSAYDPKRTLSGHPRIRELIEDSF